MKFSLEWLGEFVDTSAAGGASGVRRLLEQAGFPIESVESVGVDTILDVEITPNRPDVMSHRGLAREVAAMAGLARKVERSKPPDADERADPPSSSVSVAIEVPRLCRRFGARVLRGVGGSPAPEAVRRRLSAIGGKSISAAVDATNYVLWETGQPLHAFDLDKLSGGCLIVRRARKGEKLVLLDGVEYTLSTSDVVVADSERAVSLAGVMGGLETAVTAATRNVLLEAAWWDPVAIRKTSRRLGLHTDASHRFERGADPEAILEALERAASLVLGAAGGTLGPERIDERGQPWKRRQAKLRLARLRLLSGDSRLDLDFAADALSRLEFAVARRGQRLVAEVPSWRPDVTIEEDLVEEVLRVYGYDRLPSRLPANRGAAGQFLEPANEVESRLSDSAVSSGFLETKSTPFVDRRSDEAAFGAWFSAAGGSGPGLSLANPLDTTRRQLRATLLPGLLDALARNVHRGDSTVGLFEVGRVFDREGDPEDPASFESRRFAFVLAGDWRAHWTLPAAAGRADFFDAKGLVARLLEPFVEKGLRWNDLSCEGFAPGACALVTLSQGEPVGIVGLASAAERERRKITDPAFLAEIRVDQIPRERPRARFASYSAFPSITADLSVLLPRDASWESVERYIHGRGLADLEDIRLVDRYQGPGVPDGFVKATVRLVFRSSERTLAQADMNRQIESLAAELPSQFQPERS